MTCKGILVIEDDADIREAVQQLLELEGYTVHTASNGKEGIELLQTLDSPCVILLDLMMPVMNGWQFLDAKKQNDVLAPIPVVVSSAAGDTILPPRGVKLMRKPIDVDALIRVVETHCGHARPRLENLTSDKHAA
jgi:CheY-like chemotaxis protein